MDALERLRAIGKRPVVAQIGGFRPEERVRSWFGGRFCAPEDAEWPVDGDGPMVPVLQICVPEVPGGSAFFGDSSLVQVFLNAKELPLQFPAPNGTGWLLRQYRTLEALVTIRTPEAARRYREFQIRWSPAERLDYPCWEEASDYVDLTDLNDRINEHEESGESDEPVDPFHAEFQSYERTKIGGYASYIQSPSSKPYEYVFQIASEEKPQFMVGDSGNLYIMRARDEDHWYLHWDCF